MATREYCADVGAELEMWSDRLHKLSDEIDTIATGDKVRVVPQIEELHMIMTELDDRLCDLMVACPTVEGRTRAAAMDAYPAFMNVNQADSEEFDYSFAG